MIKGRQYYPALCCLPSCSEKSYWTDYVRNIAATLVNPSLHSYLSINKAGRMPRQSSLLRAAASFPTLADGQLRCIFIVPKRKGWLQPLITAIYYVGISVKKFISKRAFTITVGIFYSLYYLMILVIGNAVIWVMHGPFFLNSVSKFSQVSFLAMATSMVKLHILKILKQLTIFFFWQ